MTKLYTLFYIVVLFILSSANIFAQNEFYNAGGIVTLNGGSGSITPTLQVNGNLINQNGTFKNTSSYLELKGNITNNPTATFHYSSTGIERFSGSSNQTIYGTWNGTSASTNEDQFYNLKINKTSTIGENIVLDNGLVGNTVNINAGGTLNFENTNGIIRTQSLKSISPYSGFYINTFYIQNPSTSAIINSSIGNGAITKYIEGRLIRQVLSGTYFFPIGVENTGLDGMEAFSVTINSISASTGLEGYIRPATNTNYNNDLVTNGDVLFFDIGAFTNPANNNFSQCTGGPDGHDDVAVINQAITHEWYLEPKVVPTSVDYNITVLPGSTLENQISYSTLGASCNSTFTKAQYLARDGKIGGNEAVGPTINYWVPGVTGYYQKPTLKTLSNQNGFASARYRIFSSSDNNTSLPVELISFNLAPINNEYFNLTWETASEFNNAGFYVQRSTSGLPFQNIGWISGNGTTNSIQQYKLADYDVIPNTTYYYRLKQIDYDNQFKFSNTLSGVLNGVVDFNISSILPNPTTINPQVNLFAPQDGTIQIDVFDILGQKLKYQSTRLTKGKNNIELDLTDLATATYLIKFNYNNTTITKKIIKN